MLQNISNGELVISGFNLDATANYTCNPNFVIRAGLSNRVCQRNGAWSGSKPKCGKLMMQQVTSSLILDPVYALIIENNQQSVAILI